MPSYLPGCWHGSPTKEPLSTSTLTAVVPKESWIEGELDIWDTWVAASCGCRTWLEWNAEVMQHQRPFESRWHRNKTFTCPENEIFDEFAWFVQQIKWMFGRSRRSRTRFLFEGSTTEPLLAPWAWSNFIYKDVTQLWKMAVAVTSSFCFSPCALELEWFGFSIGLQELQRALKTMTLLFWRNQLWTRSMMTKVGQSECPILVLQSSLPTASFVRTMLQARARAFEIQLRCLCWEMKMIYLNLMLRGALRQCWLSFIQGVCAEDLQQLRWNDSSCMKSDFNCFATWWMLVRLETSQLDCQQLSWPETWQIFQVMKSLQTMAKAGFSCATPWMRSNMQWR